MFQPKPTTIFDKQLSQDQMFKIFIALYSLPIFGDHIRYTHYDTQQRRQKIQQLQQKINILSMKIYGTTNFNIQNLNQPLYYERKMTLRYLFVQYLAKYYPNTTSFDIAHEINIKLHRRFEKQCEDLLGDFINRRKQMEIKKYVETILENKFKDYDVDETGDVNLKELESRLNKFKLPKIVAKEIMQKADYEQDGKISLEQFKKYTEENVMKYFKIFYNLDSDNDHMLNYKQTKQSLHEIYPDIEIDKVFDKIFQTMDQNKSGLINFEQWCQFLILFPKQNFDFMVNQWKMFTFTMISTEESSSFMDKDLFQNFRKRFNTSDKLSWVDICRTLAFGGISGALSRTITAPLQMLKVLYQTMYTDTRCPSITVGLQETYMRQGLAALFRGNSLSIFISCLQQALRFTIIEYSKKVYETKGNYMKFHDYLLVGVITGVLSTMIIFPFQVLRIRFIASDDHGIWHLAKQIFRTSGIRGFYSGFTPHLISVLPAGSFNVMSYNLLRKMLAKDRDKEHPNIYKFMILGGVAALFTNTIIYPLSLITSRVIMANKNLKQFKNRVKMHNIIKDVYQKEGLRGFYKGFEASALRVFIGQSFNFGTYQALKSLWGWYNLKTKSKSKRY